MNKRELVERAYAVMGGEESPISLSVVRGALDAVLNTIKARAAAGKCTYWRGVGMFFVVVHGGRNRLIKMRKMSDGSYRYYQVEYFPAQARVRWRPSNGMREAVN